MLDACAIWIYARYVHDTLHIGADMSMIRGDAHML